MSTRWVAGSLFGLASTALALPRQTSEALLARIPEDLSIAHELLPRSNRGRFESRSMLAWSADGRQVAYAGVRGDEYVPVVGSEPGRPYAYASLPILAGGHAFFHVAEPATEAGQPSWLWVDGATVGPEDWMGDLAVSADGQRVAFWTYPGAEPGVSGVPKSTQHLLAIATESSPKHWTVSRGETWFDGAAVPPLFSASGERVTTSALVQGKGWVLIQTLIQTSGKRERALCEPQPTIDTIATSRDGSAVAYVQTQSRNGEGSPIVSAQDGAQLYFRGKRVGKKHALVDRPAVDAAGEHVAYVVGIEDKRTVAVDEEKAPAGRYDHVLELAFDPTGKRLAFVANVGGAESRDVPGDIEGGKWFVVVRSVRAGGEPEVQAPFPEVRDLSWNEAGDRLAYRAREADGWRVISGKARSELHDEVGRPSFAADGRSIGHGTRDGRDLWWRVLALE